MWHNLQFTADLVIYIKKLLNEKLHFLWSGWSEFKSNNFGKVLQLAQFLFTTSKTELNYYHQKLSVWAARKFQENLWNAWSWWRVPRLTPKCQILMVLSKSRKKSAVPYKNLNSWKINFMQKPIFLNFVNLCTTFCPGLQVCPWNFTAVWRKG